MADIKIVSWNPQGIHKNSKNTQLKCDFLEKEYNHNNFDILTLQETHHKNENTLPKYIHDLKITHAFLDSPAPENNPYAGIIVLIKNEWEIIRVMIIIEGILVQIKVKKRDDSLICNLIFVYAKLRKAEPGNYEKRINLLQEIEKAYDIYKVNMAIGDYNFIDGMYDKPANVRISHNKKLDEDWEEIRKRIKVVDPLRTSYPKLI